MTNSEGDFSQQKPVNLKSVRRKSRKVLVGQRMIQRFHDQMFQRMSPEKLARKLSVMKALAKSVRSKNKENENPVNNNMALSYNFKHSTPMKNTQVTDLDMVEEDIEEESEKIAESEVIEELEEPSEIKEIQSEVSDQMGSAESCEYPNDVTVLALEDLDDQIDKHWKSLEVLHSNAEFEFCRSLEESKLFVSSSSLLEEIEADLPSPYSLARPLNHTFHTLSSYRTQTRLARMDFSTSDPDIGKHKENRESLGPQSKKMEYLEMKVKVQKVLAEQSLKALNLSKMQKLFGVEHVESEKALLLANLRHNAAMEEAKKLKLLGEFSEKENFGQIIISNICFEINGTKNNFPEKYICTATERENVESSSVLSGTFDGKICFEESFNFENLHKDFLISVELFKLHNREPKKIILTNALARKLKKMTAINLNRSLILSPFSFSSFISIAKIEIRSKDIIQRKNNNNNNIYVLKNILFQTEQRSSAGAEVSLSIKTDLQMSSNQSGFLNMFQGTWHRRWYSLSDCSLVSWLYPEDKDFEKAPVEVIRLSDCDSVESVGLETCIRPNSFVLTSREKNGRKILFSAGTRGEMTDWMNTLNATIENIRLWKPNE